MLELLGVPLVLAVLGIWFQKTQSEQEADEAREEVLQLYFDRVSTLLIDKNLMAIAIKKKDVAAARAKGMLTVSVDTNQEELLAVAIDVIQARTSSILRRFEQDSESKTSVIRFLAEADVISRLKIDLSGTNLSGAKLSRANLFGARLSRADLSGAFLSGADLSGAFLSGANLSRADLFCANLSGADLSRAKLNSAFLGVAKLRFANLSSANLSGAFLIGADLSGADQGSANLSGANLSGADLRSADLRDANLSGADLSAANLLAATVTNAIFGAGIGLSEEEKQDLIKRGAIFDAEPKE